MQTFYIVAVDYKSGLREDSVFPLVIQLIHSFLALMFSNIEHKKEKNRYLNKK